MFALCFLAEEVVKKSLSLNIEKLFALAQDKIIPVSGQYLSFNRMILNGLPSLHSVHPKVK